MPRTGIRVVCTLRETMVTLAPTRALTRVDLPAFGAPMTAMKPQRVSLSGTWARVASGSAMGRLLQRIPSVPAYVAAHALSRKQQARRRLLRLSLGCTFTAGGLAA